MHFATSDVRIRWVLEFMSHNLDCEVSWADVASYVSLSESRLRHLFTAETGMSPRQVFTKLRLAQAKELLAEKQLTIEQVALRVGWHDRSHFDRRFKQTYGLTPAQYRVAYRPIRFRELSLASINQITAAT